MILIGMPVCSVIDSIVRITIGVINMALKSFWRVAVQVGFSATLMMAVHDAQQWQETVGHFAACVVKQYTALASHGCQNVGT